MEIVAVDQTEDEEAIPEVHSVTVKPGSVIHVKLGGDMGDGVVFTPTREDLIHMRDDIQHHFPDHKVIVTHQCVDIYVVHIDDDEI